MKKHLFSLLLIMSVLVSATIGLHAQTLYYGFPTSGGTGYTSAPTATLSGGGCTSSCATATATIAGGSVTGFAVTAGGSGYTSAPAVGLSGGGGSGAAATAIISGGAVTAINLTAVDYTLSNTPVTSLQASAAADFNLDGYQDVVIANAGTAYSITILWGAPSGGTAFGTASSGIAPTTISVCSSTAPNAVIAANLNPSTLLNGATYPAYDDYPDIVVSCPSLNEIEVFLNNGSGGFGAGTYYAVGTTPVAPIAGNFSGSGLGDLAVVNAGSSTVSILDGNGTGTFTLSSTTTAIAGATLSSITAGDFNADNLLDFAVTDIANGKVYVYLASSPGVYGSPSSYSAGSGATSIGTADLNRDGCLDLAVADSGINKITVLLGNSSALSCIGTFTPQTALANGTAKDTSQLIIKDVNEDDEPDLIAVSFGVSPAAAVLSELLNSSTSPGTFTLDNTFTLPLTEGTTRIPTAILVSSNLNLNGLPDLVLVRPLTSQVSFLMDSAPLGIAPFSWDKVPIAVDMGKRLSLFTPSEAQFVATHFNLVSIEKGQYNDGTTSGPCGSETLTEQGFCEAVNQIKPFNSNIKALFYWNTKAYYNTLYSATVGSNPWISTPGGLGYTSVPAVTITDGSGSGVTPTAMISSGVVTSISGSGGSGYASQTAANVTIAAPSCTPSPTCMQAQAVAAVSAGAVTGFALTAGTPGASTPPISSLSSLPTLPPQYIDPADSTFQSWWGTSAANSVTTAGADGIFADSASWDPADVPNMLSAYNTAQGGSPIIIYNGLEEAPQYLGLTGPTVTISGGSGSGAAATSTVNGSGAVSGITLTAGGTGYAPTATISGGGGSGATAIVIVSYNYGTVTGVTVTSGGLGYTSAPTVTISGDNGSGATATATISGGAVTHITVTNAGSGYFPAVTISGGGSGATATASASNGVITSVALTAGGSEYTSSVAYPFITGGFNEHYNLPNASYNYVQATSPPQLVPKPDFSADHLSAVIASAITAGQNEKVVLFKGWPDFSQYDLPLTGNFVATAPYGQLASAARANITSALASYLVSASHYSYFDYSWGYIEDNTGGAGVFTYQYDPTSGAQLPLGGPFAIDPSWYPELSKPLGLPLGAATFSTTTITGLSIASNVVTFTTPTNSLVAGQNVVISGLAVDQYLNGQLLTVLGTGLSSAQFEANFTHANATQPVASGIATGTLYTRRFEHANVSIDIASPVVTLSDTTGAGAIAIPTVVGGAVTGITLLSGGSGYTSPTVTITGGGTGAIATATVSGGVVTGISMTANGSGYPSNPGTIIWF